MDADSRRESVQYLMLALIFGAAWSAMVVGILAVFGR
jgi:hypothetical protein